jgi:hypothetical protein
MARVSLSNVIHTEESYGVARDHDGRKKDVERLPRKSYHKLPVTERDGLRLYETDLKSEQQRMKRGVRSSRLTSCLQS